MVARPNASPVLLAIAAKLALADPFSPQAMARDEARGAMKTLEQRDPRAWYAAYGLARLERDDGRQVDAIRDLERAADRWPEMVTFPVALAGWLQARGWDAAAARYVERALALKVQGCRPLWLARTLAKAREQGPTVSELSDALVQCDARSRARLRDLEARRDYDEATTELARLLALEPPHRRFDFAESAARLADARGQGGLATRTLLDLLQVRPREVDAERALVDHRVARGQTRAALARLDAAIDRDPTAMAELMWLRRALGGEDELAPYRIDGEAVRRAFEASGKRYDSPEVLVLDYAVTRVFPDGSSWQLTHQLVRVQSEEALDGAGEVQVPDGAHLLTLRTLKADGTALEPDPIPGKSSVSMPDLQVGDYVDFAYAQITPASETLRGGVIGDRFYFQSFTTPFDRSENVVLLPRGMTPIFERRGAAPKPTVRTEHGLRAWRFLRRHSEPWPREPNSVSPREYLPSVGWAVQVRWPDIIAGARDALADRAPIDPEAEQLVRTILAGAPAAAGGTGASAASRARALYDWTLANIDPGGSSAGLVPAMVRSRTGSRVLVLHYLLGLAGLHTDLLLVRPFTADHGAEQIPEPEAYAHILVRVQEGDRAQVLDPSSRFTPFGYLSPEVRGQSAFVLDAGAAAVQVPEGPADADQRDIDAHVALAAGGGATVTVAEHLKGAPAIAWRQNLRRIPAATRDRLFEQAYAGQLFPGSKLDALAIDGADAPYGPLTLRYTLTAPSFARRDGDRLVLPTVFPANLGATYATVAKRTTTELVPTSFSQRVRLTVDGRGVKAPAPVTIDGPKGARFEVAAQPTDTGLRAVRTLHISRARVAPEAYPAFATFCQEVDAAEDRPITASGTSVSAAPASK